MARGDFPSAKQDQYMLRFPDGMRDELKASAYGNNRSLNAEIIQRLQDSLSRDDLMERGDPSIVETPFEQSKWGLEILSNDINGMLDTLRHYRTQHMWRDQYCDTPEDEELMTALDFYLDDERAYWIENSDLANDPRQHISRAQKIRNIMANWLSSRGYLEVAEDGALSAVDPEVSFSPGYGDDLPIFTKR